MEGKNIKIPEPETKTEDTPTDVEEATKTEEKPVAKAAVGSKKGNVNSLTRDWMPLAGGVLICPGLVSQAHKKYRSHNEQGASVCVLACAFSALKELNTWTSHTIDEILDLGNVLHLKTRQIPENRCRQYIGPRHVYKYFFLGDYKVSMKIDVHDVKRVRIFNDRQIRANLQLYIQAFLMVYPRGIFAYGHRYFAFWSFDKFFFLFDPIEHDVRGNRWDGVPGLGISYAMRYADLSDMVETVINNLDLKYSNKFKLYPCTVEKLVKFSRNPPEKPDGLQPPEEEKPVHHPKATKRAALAKGEPEATAAAARIPPERPKLDSVTNFTELIEGKCGILRASTHQNDPNFTKYAGFQSFGNAVAALTMLRVVKAKHWTRNVLNRVLKTGEHIHHDSLSLPPNDVITSVTIDDQSFKPFVRKYEGGVGQLLSTESNVLSLEEALGNYFLENDCAILVGPNTVAVWKEDQQYYMFDPNERDEHGRLVTDKPGVACVTRYTHLKDLVTMYMSNIDSKNYKSKFVLGKVTISDLPLKAEDLNNFRALTIDKWILRGTFSQSDRRFPKESQNSQCTANAAMALGYKEIVEEKEWDASLVDEILTKGDEYYNACVAILNENGKFKHTHLMVDELKRTFDLPERGKRVLLEIDDCLVNGIITAKDDDEILNLKRGFEEFFGSNDSGIVTANDQSMAVWKRDDVYYYFDSHTRNGQGLRTNYGTACLLRLLTLAELEKMLLSNLRADKENLYNINRVVVKTVDITEDGYVKPPLNNYTAIDDCKSILRSTLSEKSPKFELNGGKQTVPNCLVALAMNTVVPSDSWTVEDLDHCLIFGDKLYEASMEANYKEDVPEEMNVDDVTTNNVEKKLKIGSNVFDFEMEEISRGNLEENLKDALEGLREERNELFQTILESQYMTVAMWRDENLYYLFDPRPRDELGQVYGKDDWSVTIGDVEEAEEEEVEGEEDEGEEDDDEDDEPARGGHDDDDDEIQKDDVDDAYGDDDEWGEEEEVEGEEVGEPPLPEKKGSAYWRQQEEGGKACVMRFSKQEDLINHLLENSPPNHRQEVEYTWKTITITNRPELHEIYDPNEGDKEDEFAGDWFNFAEIDRRRWILRGNKPMVDAMFPETNRGKQQNPASIIALCYTFLYGMHLYKPSTVDDIITYGDRYYTVAKKLRAKDFKDNKDLNLTADAIEELIATINYKLTDYPEKLCIENHKVTWKIRLEQVIGDITSTAVEEVADIATGLANFFAANTYGVLQCKDYTVSLWKIGDAFYMFDPHQCGPGGYQSPVGVPCITRFIELNELAQLYSENLPEVGSHFFTMHSLDFSVDICERPGHLEVKKLTISQVSGFTPVVLGKDVLRGGLKLTCKDFSQGVHIHSAPIAYAALAMTLVKHPMTWTKMLIDEIMLVGRDLYVKTVEKLGDRFDPWSDVLDVCRVRNDFKIGGLKANCAIRLTEQHGLVDIKNSKTLNLRQGLEKFFEENTHGILLTHRLTLAVWEWEAEDGEMYIYLYDPNSRGGTGLPTHGGFACAVRFANAKLASDHVMACLMDVDKTTLPFMILPVEIVVGMISTPRKKKCPALDVAKVPPQIKTTPVTCPTPTQLRKQAQLLKQQAELTCHKKQQRRLSQLGRVGMYKINEDEWIVRGLRQMVKDREGPVNFAAFVLMSITLDLDLWNWKHIELILETGYLLHIDSCIAYEPNNTKLNLENILRTLTVMETHEVKVKIFRPLFCGPFVHHNVSNVLNSCFMETNSCLLNYEDFLVTIYFTKGYYYLFDPYGRDLNGDRTEENGCAMLMKFGSIQSLVNKLVYNLGIADEEAPHGDFVLLFLSIESVKPI